MSTMRLDARSGVSSWAVAGLIAGIIAGAVFIVFEVVVAAAMQGNPAAPIRMISAIVLGQGALPMQPTIGLATAVPVGLIVHFVNSAIYGVVFAVVAASVGFLRDNRWALIVAASVFGLLLWLVNFYVIAPILFPWFLMANPVVQFLAHTFFFGTALGLLLAARLGSGGRRTTES